MEPSQIASSIVGKEATKYHTVRMYLYYYHVWRADALSRALLEARKIQNYHTSYKKFE